MEKLPFYDRQKLSGCHSYTLSPLNVPLYSFFPSSPIKKIWKTAHNSQLLQKKRKNKRKKLRMNFDYDYNEHDVDPFAGMDYDSLLEWAQENR